MPKNKNLSKSQLNHFQNLLLEIKKEIEAKIDATRDISPNDAIHELADFDNHPADMGTEQFEQERDAGFDLMRKDQLQEIKDALERIDTGTYGVSEVSGKPIPVERLEAMPTAKTLVDEEVAKEDLI